MAIFLTWYRTFWEKNKYWVEPNFVVFKTSRFNRNVKYNIKMTTLHDRTTIKTNWRKYRTEKQTNNSQQKVPGLKFNTLHVRFVHTRLTSDAQMKTVWWPKQVQSWRALRTKSSKSCDQYGQGKEHHLQL